MAKWLEAGSGKSKKYSLKVFNGSSLNQYSKMVGRNASYFNSMKANNNDMFKWISSFDSHLPAAYHKAFAYIDEITIKIEKVFWSYKAKRYFYYELIELGLFTSEQSAYEGVNSMLFANRLKFPSWTKIKQLTVLGDYQFRDMGKVNYAQTNRHKKVQQLTMEGKIVATYDSPINAEKYGFNRSRISHVCLGKAKHHQGFKWRYVDETI